MSNRLAVEAVSMVISILIPLAVPSFITPFNITKKTRHRSFLHHLSIVAIVMTSWRRIANGRNSSHGVIVLQTNVIIWISPRNVISSYINQCRHRKVAWQVLESPAILLLVRRSSARRSTAPHPQLLIARQLVL